LSEIVPLADLPADLADEADQVRIELARPFARPGYARRVALDASLKTGQVDRIWVGTNNALGDPISSSREVRFAEPSSGFAAPREVFEEQHDEQGRASSSLRTRVVRWDVVEQFDADEFTAARFGLPPSPPTAAERAPWKWLVAWTAAAVWPLAGLLACLPRFPGRRSTAAALDRHVG
jgi:hypothetical protein